MKYQRHSTPITHRDNGLQTISSALWRKDFDKLDSICRKLGTTKSEFIRKVVEQELALWNNP